MREGARDELDSVLLLFSGDAKKQINGEEGRKGSEISLIWSPVIYNL